MAENWNDDHIPEAVRLVRRRWIEAQWEVTRARKAVDDAQAELADAEDLFAQASVEYQQAVAALPYAHTEGDRRVSE